jgi:hypothetical protein
MPIRRPWQHRAIESISLQLTGRSSPKMHNPHSSPFGGAPPKTAGGEIVTRSVSLLRVVTDSRLDADASASRWPDTAAAGYISAQQPATDQESGSRQHLSLARTP